MKVYVIGSLRNPAIPEIARKLRDAGIRDVFDDWYAAGPEADDYWQRYEKENRMHSFAEALQGHSARHVFEYDREHLDSSDAVVLALPAGKSGHLEAGYCVGRGIPLFILMPGEPERFDVMYGFAEDVYTNEVQLQQRLLELQDDLDNMGAKF